MPPKPPPTPLTHFLCLPLATPTSIPSLQTSLSRFSQDKAILPTPAPPTPSGATSKPSASASPPSPDSPLTDTEDDHAGGNAFLPPKAIRPVGTLHLTLGVMSLHEKSRVEAAVAFLGGLDLRGMMREAETEAEQKRGEGGGEGKAEGREGGEKVESRAGEDRTPAAAAAAVTGMATGLGAVVSGEEGGGEIKGQSFLGSGEGGRRGQGQRAMSLSLTLCGLHAMGASKVKTSSLYAEPCDESGRLYPFCRRLREAFEAAGFVMPEKRELKLHATILNTIYASEKKGKGGGRGKGRGKREGSLKFDATELMERWRDVVWAEVKVERVVVCEMGAKEDESGWVRYVEVGGVDMPC